MREFQDASSARKTTFPAGNDAQTIENIITRGSRRKIIPTPILPFFAIASAKFTARANNYATQRSGGLIRRLLAFLIERSLKVTEGERSARKEFASVRFSHRGFLMSANERNSRVLGDFEGKRRTSRIRPQPRGNGDTPR